MGDSETIRMMPITLVDWNGWLTPQLFLFSSSKMDQTKFECDLDLPKHTFPLLSCHLRTSTSLWRYEETTLFPISNLIFSSNGHWAKLLWSTWLIETPPSWWKRLKRKLNNSNASWWSPCSWMVRTKRHCRWCPMTWCSLFLDCIHRLYFLSSVYKWAAISPFPRLDRPSRTARKQLDLLLRTPRNPLRRLMMSMARLVRMSLWKANNSSPAMLIWRRKCCFLVPSKGSTCTEMTRQQWECMCWKIQIALKFCLIHLGWWKEEQSWWQSAISISKGYWHHAKCFWIVHSCHGTLITFDPNSLTSRSEWPNVHVPFFFFTIK